MVCPQPIQNDQCVARDTDRFDCDRHLVKTCFSEDMSIPDTPSEKAMDVIQKEFSKGPDKGSIRVIFGAEDGKKLTSKPEKQAIEETLKKIKTDHSVASIASPFETGTISKDGSVAYADITYKKRRMTLRMRLFHILNTVCPPPETRACRRSSAAMCRGRC